MWKSVQLCFTSQAWVNNISKSFSFTNSFREEILSIILETPFMATKIMWADTLHFWAAWSSFKTRSKIVMHRSIRLLSGSMPPFKWFNCNVNPGAPGAGSSCYFRLSSLILRDTEVIATNTFFQKKGARFSDIYKYSKHE